MTTRTLAAVLVCACAAAISPDAGHAAERIEVCADRLELNRQPNQGRDGVLRRGQSMDVRRFSPSGKYAYGLAYGNINRVGWVRTAGLCDSDRARASVRDRLVGERIAVCARRLELNRRPNEGWDGVLRRDQTFKVRKLSGSGKYAHGFAYGNINRVGWVRTDGLC